MKWKNVLYIILTSITIITFAGTAGTIFVNYRTVPISTKAEANAKDIAEVKKCMEDRPTNGEINPKLDSIKDDVAEIKESVKDINRLLVDILRKGK